MRFVIVLFSTLILGSSYAQGLLLDDLLLLQKSSAEYVNDKLMEKGWEFSGSSISDVSEYKTITWRYSKNSIGEESCWLTMYTSGNDDNIITYNFFDLKYYQSIKESIIANKMKMNGSTIGDNSIATVYKGENYTVILDIGSGTKYNSPSYVVTVVSNTIMLGGQLQNILGLYVEEKGDKEDPQGSLVGKALYGKPGGGLGGSSLDLAGWQWDAIPNPDIRNNESGRVVFEIKIDGSGEIISIKTLERSVSLETENVCRREIEKLKFSKTGTNVPSISTGKITFVFRSN
jgi:hypothetical protein